MKRIMHILLLLVQALAAVAGGLEKNARLDGAGLYTPGNTLVVKYDKYSSLPFPAVNPPITINQSTGLIGFGIDETKKIYHASNLTAIITFTYKTQDFFLS